MVVEELKQLTVQLEKLTEEVANINQYQKQFKVWPMTDVVVIIYTYKHGLFNVACPTRADAWLAADNGKGAAPPSQVLSATRNAIVQCASLINFTE